MVRTALCSLILLALSVPAAADELDKEFARKPAPPAAGSSATLPGGSELDRESPAQACHWRGGWGYGPYYSFGYSPVGFGYSSFGYSGFAPSFVSYPSFGYSALLYRPRYYSAGFYGGFGGFGYRSFYGYGGFGPYPGWYW